MTLFRSFSFYLALIGLIIGALFVWKIMAPGPVSVPLVQPAANPYDKAVAASGIIEAQDRNISIGSPVSGLVEDILVDVGQRVTKGEVLFIIDRRDLKALLEVQIANIKVSEANLERLNDQLKRLESVKDLRAVSKDEVKTKQNDVHVAEAQLAASKYTAEETQVLIDRLSVEAPREGIILQNNIRIGEYLSINSSTPAMVLGNLDLLQIRADIDEQNAASFNPKSKAVAFPRNNTELAIPLKFSYIEPYVIPKKSLTGSSQERVDTRVLQVIYTFERPKDFPIYVGQQVDVFIDAAPGK